MWILNFIQKHPFEATLIGCVAVILILALFRIGKKGTWDKDVFDMRFSNSSSPPVQAQRKESAGEARCRAFLEQYFVRRFPSTRPDFLNNPVTGSKHNLELDCYNSEMALAVEYNGRQHYEYTPFFHKNKEAFYNQKYRDDMKRRMCQQAGITLIEVPYNATNIEQFLESELRKLGYAKR